jgi:truncated hemoglobin YjbI
MKPTQTPTLYAWVGGIESIEALLMKFYERMPVGSDRLSARCFGAE